MWLSPEATNSGGFSPWEIVIRTTNPSKIRCAVGFFAEVSTILPINAHFTVVMLFVCLSAGGCGLECDRSSRAKAQELESEYI
jgi:hypothetical protein